MLLAVLLSLSTAATAHAPPPQPIEQKQAVKAYWASVHGCTHGHHRKTARRGIRKRLMARRNPGHFIRCAMSRRSRKKLRAYTSHYRPIASYRRQLYAVTPYRCGSFRSAIPCGIVACESGFSWTAHNPSSPARGPYQLLGHGEPWPVRSKWDKLRHHQIAYALFAGGRGRGAWVC